MYIHVRGLPFKVQAPIRPSYSCLIFFPACLCTSEQQECSLALFFLLLWLSFSIFSCWWKQLRQQTALSYFKLSFYLDCCSHSTISCQSEEQWLCTPVSTLGMYYSITAATTYPARSLCSCCWSTGTISSPGGFLREREGRSKMPIQRHDIHEQESHPEKYFVLVPLVLHHPEPGILSYVCHSIYPLFPQTNFQALD